MCGIAGIFSSDPHRPNAEARVRRMIRTLRHRGPDGDGFHLEPHASFGFCRLAIIDLAGGQQPLCNEDGNVWLVFNGEIYNYQELADTLRQKGHTFRSKSDSETIVHAYEEWGEGCVDKLRGIFAFAIWDRRARRLMLARDHSGIKPLFMVHNKHELVFASEAKALLADQPATRALDLFGYAVVQDSATTIERTNFRGVSSLAPGCILLADDAGQRTRRYWSYEPTLEPGDERSIEQWCDAFGHELERSVREQVMADVPIGAYLSGGVDSAAVVAGITRMGRKDLATFTTVNSGVGEDERYARMCADALELSNARFFQYDARADTVALLPLVAWMAEGELDAGYIARYQLARFAASHGIKVVLTGQGIDEILTGYYPSFAHFVSQLTQQAWARRGSHGYRGLAPFARELLSDDFDQAKLAAQGLRDAHRTLDIGLLRFEDRMGMAASVEVRVPLLDHRLLELCAQIPPSKRPDLLGGKAILRRAVAPWLPNEIAQRPKFAFNATMLPLTRMVESSGESGAWLRALLSEEEIKRAGYFEPGIAEQARIRSNYAALDHILIVQLLHHLFVSHFDAERFSEPPPLENVLPSERRREPRSVTLRADHVPRLHNSLANIAKQHIFDAKERTLVSLPLLANFLERDHEPIVLSDDALAVLTLIDGMRTYQDIVTELEGKVTLEDLLVFCSNLVENGLLTA